MTAVSEKSHSITFEYHLGMHIFLGLLVDSLFNGEHGNCETSVGGLIPPKILLMAIMMTT